MAARHAFRHALAFLLLAWIWTAWAQEPEPPAPAPPCGAPGTPCAASSDPTSQASVNTSTGAGNPIDVVTGNKYLREIDTQWSSGELSLTFTRHYNSQSQFSRSLSPGWSHSYEAVLTRFNFEGQTARIEVIQGDGRKIKFEASSAQGGIQRYVSIPRGYGIIEENSAAVAELLRGNGKVGPPWRWAWPDGRTIHFGARGLVDTIADASGDELRLAYDNSARLIEIRDRAQRVLRLEYWQDSEPQLRDFGSDLSAPTLFGRKGSLKAIHLPDRSWLEYWYDSAGALSRVMYPDRTSTEYRYEERGGVRRLTEVIGRDRKPRARYAYDAAGRAIASSQPGGVNAVKLEYRLFDAKANLGETRLTNSKGDVTLFRWTPAGPSGEPKLLEALGPGCASCPQSNVRYSYDSHGRIARIDHLAEADTTASGVVRVSTQAATSALPTAGRVIGSDRYTYDTHGRLLTHYQEIEGVERLVERRRYAPGSFADKPTRIETHSVAPGKFRSLDITYNSRGQPLQLVQRGFSPRWTRDRRAQHDPIEEVIRLAYYESSEGNGGHTGRLKSIDGPMQGVRDRIEFDYTAAGLLSRVQYPEGVSDTYVYDALGRLIERTPENGLLHRFSYAPSSQLYLHAALPTEISRGGLVTKLELNHSGQVLSYALPSGERLELIYDDAQRLHRIVDVQGSATTFEYDTEGNRTLLTSAASAVEDGHRIERIVRAAYDSFQRLTNIAGSGETDTKFQYDARGLLTKVVHADERARDSAEHALSNDIGFKESLTLDVRSMDSDPELNEESPTYARRLVNAALAALRGQHDRFLIEQSVRWHGFEGPKSELSAFLKDDFGRVVREDSNDAGWVEYTYAAGNEPVRICRANGTCDEFTYDGLARPITRTARDAQGNATISKATYRGAHLRSLSNPSQSTTYEYDASARLVARTDTLAAGVYRWTWKFDERGRLQSRGLPGGYRLHVRYADALPYPIGIDFEDANGKQRAIVSNIGFNSLEHIAQFRYGNGLEKTLSHDAKGRLTAVTIARPSEKKRNVFAAIPTATASSAHTVWQQRFRYNDANQVRAMHVRDRDVEIGYDNFGRLTYLRDAIAAAAIEYDAGGNVVAWTRNERRTDFRYRPFSNRLLNVRGSEVSHDESGNVTTVDGLHVSYGPDNRVTSIRNGKGQLQEYEYNALGERTFASGAGSRPGRYFLYDRSRVSTEIRADGTIAAHYVYLGDEPVAKIEPIAQRSWFEQLAAKLTTRFASDAQLRFIHADHLGTPQFATDDEQGVVWEIQHDAYGAGRVSAASQMELNLRYPGQYFDAFTGLHYNYQRYYAPSLARYLQPDPLGIAAGFNVYEYAASDPLTNVDPRGESIVSWLGKRAGMRIVQREIRRYMRDFAQSRIATIVRRWADRGMDIADQFQEAQEIMRILDGASGIGVWDVVGLVPVIGDAVDIGRTVRQLCRIKDLIKRLDRKLIGFNRLPVSGGSWTRGVAGNGQWLPDRNSAAWRATRGQPIRYVDGFPDFTPFTYVDRRGRRGEVTIRLSGDSAADIREARRAMRARHPDWVEPPNHTWHHDTRCGRMILVSTAINDIPHAGGDAIHRQGLCN